MGFFHRVFIRLSYLAPNPIAFSLNCVLSRQCFWTTFRRCIRICAYKAHSPISKARSSCSESIACIFGIQILPSLQIEVTLDFPRVFLVCFSMLIIQMPVCSDRERKRFGRIHSPVRQELWAIYKVWRNAIATLYCRDERTNQPHSPSTGSRPNQNALFGARRMSPGSDSKQSLPVFIDNLLDPPINPSGHQFSSGLNRDFSGIHVHCYFLGWVGRGEDTIDLWVSGIQSVILTLSCYAKKWVAVFCDNVFCENEWGRPRVRDKPSNQTLYTERLKGGPSNYI